MQENPFVILMITLGVIGNLSWTGWAMASIPPVDQENATGIGSCVPGSCPLFLTQGNRVQIRLQLYQLRTVEDEQGNVQNEWVELPATASVQPGDILRYAIAAENQTAEDIPNFILTQPIPDPVVYIPDSSRIDTEAEITVSIDNGETFVKNPTVEVTLENGQVETQPAPPETYTHLRWTLTNPLPPTAVVTGQFEVRVQ
ncbi:hypothetical protein [Laspinema olomoucense]|uniref:hypothetical protein n=1 Tax=Laspinema olomoucense TaxID=3231600 RepID=UPI0021BB9A76|nr:hypothetical protein [Laspinema sp. D3c]MCT7993242.1 hypothetical protein [Laspinema sp. D3c]